jgi:hypothetical protein
MCGVSGFMTLYISKGVRDIKLISESRRKMTLLAEDKVRTRPPPFLIWLPINSS